FHRRYNGRRRHGGDDFARRLYQAKSGHPLPRATARRQGQDRHDDERGRLCRVPVYRVDAFLHSLFHYHRKSLLDQSARAAAGKPGGVRLTDGNQEIILSTADGQSIRFKEEQVRPTGRGTFGVVGMRLDAGDKVVNMEILSLGADILTVAEGGYGKRTEMDEYRLQSRGGKGVI